MKMFFLTALGALLFAEARSESNWIVAAQSEPNSIHNGIQYMINSVSDHVGFSAREREIKRQIIELCNRFLVEDGNTHWNIKEPRGYDETMLFSITDPGAKSRGRYVGFSVEILDMNQNTDIFPVQTVSGIWEVCQKDKTCRIIPGKSSFTVLESSPTHMVYTWVLFGDGKNQRQSLKRFDIVGSKLVFKTVRNEERHFTKEEVALWQERFKQIPAV